MRPTPLRVLPLLAACAVSTPALAKPPTLDRLFPAGAQRGQTVEIAAEGDFDPWPVRVWVLGEGVEVRPAESKGKLSVTVAPNAPTGVAWLRLYNEEGASALRPFVVGALPEVAEDEPNDAPAEAQAMEGTALTVNGRLAKNGDVDGFAVTLEAGQTLVASLEANRPLGSPMDAILQVATPSGLVVDQVDDAGGLDPRLVFVAPERGEYVVRTFAFPATPDSSIRFFGNASSIYRLTLTTGPFADYAVPLAVPQDHPGWVGVVGWNLPDDARTLPAVPVGTAPGLALADHPALPAAAEVRLVGHPVALERPAIGPDSPQPIEAPVSLTGRIAAEGERDLYRFRASKGQARLIRVASRSLGFPLDPVLRILDAEGKVVAESDDADRSHRDPEVRFNPPADGEFRVEVRDLNGRGGPRCVYRLDLLAVEPDVELTLKADRFTLTPGKPLEIPVTIERRNGFDGTLTLDAGGLPEGVTATLATSEPKAKSATLTLSSEGAPGWSGPIRIVGRSEGLPGTHTASASLDGLDATTDLPWLTVLPPKDSKPEPTHEGK